MKVRMILGALMLALSLVSAAQAEKPGTIRYNRVKFKFGQTVWVNLTDNYISGKPFDRNGYIFPHVYRSRQIMRGIFISIEKGKTGAPDEYVATVAVKRRDAQGQVIVRRVVKMIPQQRTIIMKFEQPIESAGSGELGEIAEENHTVKIGDTATVPSWEWVKIMNLEPVVQKYRNCDSSLKYGDTCGVEPGGLVTAVGTEKNKVLVRYEAPGNPMGTPCPSGILYFVTKKKFCTMQKEYERIQKEIYDEKNLVRRLLKK